MELTSGSPATEDVLENIRSKRWLFRVLASACVTMGLVVMEEAAAQTDAASGESSFGQSITSAFKNLGKPSPPLATPDDDPVSLKTKPKVGVELYVAVGHLYLQTGKFAEAEEQYQQALRIAPNDVRALLGYAMLKDQMNQPQEALKYYQQAEKKYPKQAAIYNNLAVHFARRNMVREAIEAGQRAAELRPREPRYRNNLAALLVEAGLPQEAYKQLREVYDEPVAHYNLGFLLNKRGLKPAALQEFTIALQLSPGMALARQWVERLTREHDEVGVAVVGGPSPEVGTVAVSPQVARPMPTTPAMPERAAPPVCASAPQYANPMPPAQYPTQALPAQGPSPVASPGVARWDNAAPGQSPGVVPQYRSQEAIPGVAGPRNSAPQNTMPQYMVVQPSPNPVSLAPARAMPLVVARDPQAAAGVRVIPPPANDGSTIRRLPPVNDPATPADARFQGPNLDLVAPNPPQFRR
jgi:Tfp pilus assembly protein PilF